MGVAILVDNLHLFQDGRLSRLTGAEQKDLNVLATLGVIRCIVVRISIRWGGGGGVMLVIIIIVKSVVCG